MVSKYISTEEYVKLNKNYPLSLEITFLESEKLQNYINYEYEQEI